MKKNFIVFLSVFVPLVLSAKLTQPQESMATSYTIQNGDTLYTIARKYHTTIRDLLTVNHLDSHAVIKVGQKLYLSPRESLSPSRAPKVIAKRKVSSQNILHYTVQSGDTLYTIAHTHHTSIRALLQANAMDRSALIKVGQSLLVPSNTYFPEKVLPQKVPSHLVSVPALHPQPSHTKVKPPKGTYTVQAGDTLFSIARKNHVVISKLMKLNGMGLTDQLHIGQILRTSSQNTFVASATITEAKKVISETQPKTPVGAMPSYTVKKGDTLWRIAQKHHLTLAEIRALNKMRKKDRIHTGMVLAVGKAVQAPAKTYKVRRGDTLWLIAKKNHMRTKTLRKLNGMHRRDRIHTGMVLALAKGVKISTVLAKIKKSKKKQKSTTIKTPLRIAKSKHRKKTNKRMSSALAMLNGGRSSHAGWSGSNKTIRIAKHYLGRRYVWGAVGPRTFDCSGFTQYVMRKSKGVSIPRVSRKQAYYGRYISRSHLRAGDLIFFDTSHRRRGYVNHVGIYIGNHKFIHASSARHRVVITSLNRPFYSARFKWGRRVN